MRVPCVAICQTDTLVEKKFHQFRVISPTISFKRSARVLLKVQRFRLLSTCSGARENLADCISDFGRKNAAAVAGWIEHTFSLAPRVVDKLFQTTPKLLGSENVPNSSFKPSSEGKMGVVRSKFPTGLLRSGILPSPCRKTPGIRTFRSNRGTFKRRPILSTVLQECCGHHPRRHELRACNRCGNPPPRFRSSTPPGSSPPAPPGRCPPVCSRRGRPRPWCVCPAGRGTVPHAAARRGSASPCAG